MFKYSVCRACCNNQLGDRRAFQFREPWDAYLDTDTISYQLPANFSIEAAPPIFALDTPFGSYHASTALNAGTLEYVRRLEIRERTLPADQCICSKPAAISARLRP